MSSPYVGEIRMFGGSFAPAGWALCQGQTMAISQNDVLFQLIGTTYGGDGQNTFNLPNLSGRAPMHQGQGPGITQSYIIGEAAGVESVTLATNQIPAHNHAWIGSTDPAQTASPANGVVSTAPTLAAYFAADADGSLNANSLQAQGGSQPHENMQPFLVVTFIISLFGIFPSAT